MKVQKAEDFKHFQHLEPGELRDKDIHLKLNTKWLIDIDEDYPPGYKFDILLNENNTLVGRIHFLVGLTEKLSNFGGHVGYQIEKQFRGNNYAVISCRLLFDFIKKHGVSEILVTCDPENIPSKKTCEKLGGILLKTETAEIEKKKFRVTSYYKIKV